jgi:hypothetical protein
VRRVLLAVAVTWGLLVLTPSPSWACSCAMVPTSQHVSDAGTVAAGTVVWTATDGQTRTYEVDVDGVYKGAAARSEKLITHASEAACGVGHLATGRRYLFFIDGRHPGLMRIGLCGGTVAYDAAIAHEIEAVTGPPGRPLATAGAAADPGDGSPRAGMLGIGGAAALVLLAVVAFVVRRRDDRSWIG